MKFEEESSQAIFHSKLLTIAIGITIMLIGIGIAIIPGMFFIASSMIQMQPNTGFASIYTFSLMFSLLLLVGGGFFIIIKLACFGTHCVRNKLQ